jgi:para-aminobenzoate synthetase component 1
MKQTIALDEIPYSHDSCELFERLRDLPYPVLLDSSHPHARGGRYDIMSARPAQSDVPLLRAGAGEAEAREYFRELNAFHREYFGDIQPASHDIPFCGGLLGYLAYDVGNSLHDIKCHQESRHPAAQLLPYDWCLVQDHLLRRAILVTLPQVSPGFRRELLARLGRPLPSGGNGFGLTAPFVANMDESSYRGAFNRIQSYIRAGDCYQVNLARCFGSRYRGDPWQAYRRLRALAAAPFSAFLELAAGDALLCLSPERFIALHGHHVETSPIKGTRPRHGDALADRLAAEELLASSKDRAENLMIVDLLRNDLGRNCVPGSIHVDKLFEVQSYPTVHHLVSTISGELRDGATAVDLLRDSFPGGSITGAPKRRAMEIIAELEPAARLAYCGSIAYISADGRMDSNIAIRSLWCENGELRCWGGGGIVADSQWQQEYRETTDKVGRFLADLEETLLDAPPA